MSRLIKSLSKKLLSGPGAKRNFNPRVIKGAVVKASQNIEVTKAVADSVRFRVQKNSEINFSVLNRRFTR